MSLLRSSVAHGLAGFVLMGGWAVFSNRGHPMPVPVVAGLVQGCLTAAITLILKQVIEAVFARFAPPWRLILPPLAAAALSVCVLTLVHSLAGTPALWLTLSVPLSVSTGYAILYTITLRSHG